MPGTIPSPLPKWAKWALYLATNPPASYLVSLLDFLGAVPDFTQPGSSWRHVECVYSNTGTGASADNAIVTFDIANITAGVLDDSWTAADYNTVDQHLGALCSTWMARAPTWSICKELRYYKRAFNPYSNPKPFTVSGPPEHVHPIGTSGQGTSFCPPQVALTHTEKTPYPRHWGRAYWPFLGPDFITAGGYWNNAQVDSWALSVHDVYAQLMDAEFFPCVPTTQVLGVASRNLLGINAVQVDNVIDVIRRRRIRTTTHKSSLPL